MLGIFKLFSKNKTESRLDDPEDQTPEVKPADSTPVEPPVNTAPEGLAENQVLAGYRTKVRGSNQIMFIVSDGFAHNAQGDPRVTCEWPDASGVYRSKQFSPQELEIIPD